MTEVREILILLPKVSEDLSDKLYNDSFLITANEITEKFQSSREELHP